MHLEFELKSVHNQVRVPSCTQAPGSKDACMRSASRCTISKSALTISKSTAPPKKAPFRQ